MMSEQKEIKLSGTALKALVRAAEAPIVGHGVKKKLLSQMGLDELFELDLRELGDPAPWRRMTNVGKR
jgi:hypothetical protein